MYEWTQYTPKLYGQKFRNFIFAWLKWTMYRKAISYQSLFQPNIHVVKDSKRNSTWKFVFPKSTGVYLVDEKFPEILSPLLLFDSGRSNLSGWMTTQKVVYHAKEKRYRQDKYEIKGILQSSYQRDAQERE